MSTLSYLDSKLTNELNQMNPFIIALAPSCDIGIMEMEAQNLH